MGAYKKEMFHEQKISKLMPRRDDPFQTIEIINDNACKMDLLGEYGVNATFNISDLSLFEVGDDSRMNHSEKRGNDAIQATPRYPLKVSIGLVTRLGAKRFKETFNGLLQDTWCNIIKFKYHIYHEHSQLFDKLGNCFFASSC